MRRFGVLTLALLALTPAASWGQKIPVPLGPQFQVNANVYYDYNQGIYGGPEVAADGAGNFVVVWEGYGKTEGRRFNSFGVPLGGNFGFKLPGSGYSYTDSPVVSAEGAGNFVVVWEEADDVPYKLAAQRYASSGAPLGAAFQVNVATTGVGQGFPAGPEVAHVGGGDFVVVWGDVTDNQVGSYFVGAVVGQRFDSTGAPVGSEFRVNALDVFEVGYTVADPPDGIGIAGRPNGGFVVVWHGYYPDPDSDQQLFARLFDSGGTPLGTEFQVNAYTTGFPNRPAVAVDSDGSFVIVWDDFSAAVSGRRYDSAGTPLGAEFQVSTGVVGDYDVPKVATDGAGNFMVAWLGPYSVLGRQFDSAGTPVGGEFEVSQPSVYPGSVWEPDIATTGAHEFVVVWAGFDDYTGDWDVFARRIGDGVPCSAAPKTTCRQQTAPQGVFRFTQATDPRRSRLAWRWAKGEVTTPEDYGDPFTDTDYAVCVYDASAAPQPILTAFAPARATCGNLPCWRTLSGPGPTIEYIDAATEFGNSSNPDGLRRVRLRPGAEGNAVVIVEGRGENLPLPDLPLIPPVTVQLQASTEECWTAAYNAAAIRANGDGRFRARPGS